jgi:hypothetical protein
MEQTPVEKNGSPSGVIKHHLPLFSSTLKKPVPSDSATVIG